MTMIDLSKEVLACALNHARKASTIVQFKACLLVCKGWHEQESRLLYHDVLLYNRNMSIFVSKSCPTLRKQSRSVTLIIDPPGCTERELDYIDTFLDDRDALSQAKRRTREDGGERTKALWLMLDRLLEQLKDMPLLTPFSLEVTDCGSNSTDAAEGDPDQGFSLPNKLLARCLDALVNKCTNLQLDTGGYNRRENATDKTLHESLARLLPRLERLRLLVAGLDVSALAHQSTSAAVIGPKLKDLILDTAHSNFVRGPACTELDENDLDSNRDQQEWDAASADLITKMQTLVSSSALPLIESCQVIEYHDNLAGVGVDDHAYSGIYMRDMLASKTTVMPYWLLRLSQEFRKPDIWVCRLHHQQVIADAVARHTDAVGSFSDIRAVAQGDPWPRTVSGCRLPQSQIRLHDWSTEEMLRCRGLGAPDENAHGVTCDLWEKEERGCCCLLESIVFEGVTGKANLRSRLAAPRRGEAEPELDVGGLFD